MDGRRFVAPVVITVFLVIILVSYMFFWSVMPIHVWLKLGLLCVFLGLIGISVYNLCERIEEIRSGEEDDLSQY